MHDGPDCGGSCEPGDRPLADLRLGPLSEAALQVMRFCFTTFAQPNSQAWIGAQEWAVASAGETKGSKLAFRCMRLVQALRMSRRTPFRFSNPTCPQCRAVVTETERRLMLVVGHLQREERSAAYAEAMLLCEGSAAAPLLAAADALGELLDARAPERIGGHAS
ncbi:MAG: hypothetical protein AAF763_15045 [Pseudomonadota bacterium]